MCKKIIISTLIGIVVILSGCNKAQTELISKDTSGELAVLDAPYFFSSRQEFKESIKSDIQKEKLTSQYLLTDMTIDGFTFSHILYRENIYIASYYTVDNCKYNDKYNEYENERMSTAIYEVSLFPNLQESLKINHIDKGFLPIDVGDNTHYYTIEYATNNDIIGYEFAFVTNDSLIYIHLPSNFIKLNSLSKGSGFLEVHTE